MGLGAFDPDHEQSLYWYGMHGTVAGNWAVCESDLLICAGARFDDRITGVVSKYAPEAYVIHFDVDQSEHNKMFMPTSLFNLKSNTLCKDW